MIISQEQQPILEFGTGGIRGIMGEGLSCINTQTVERILQGFANYIHTNASETEQRQGIAIAYDSRHYSNDFAKIAAGVLAKNKIPVFIFHSVATTPMLSFTIRHLKCLGGICITASHNPPQYNGIKIYWKEGAQIVPPQDANIAQAIHNVPITNILDDNSFADGFNRGLIQYINESVHNAYFDDLLNTIRINADVISYVSSLSIVYTPLHGTGLQPVSHLLNLLNCKNYFIVPEQAQPDGAFPTVKKPNPEEPEALTLAIKYATKRNADIVFATDPDSDRLAICVKDASYANGIYKNQSLGDYVLFNGNQTSALLLNFILSSLHDNGQLFAQSKVIKTIVTTGLLESICHAYNIEIFNTPTGFKWIADLIKQWETTHPEYKFLFGAEESFGYMLANNVRDKDAIAALGCAIHMIAFYKSKQLSLCDALFQIFKKFGAWQEDLISFEFENSLQGKNNIVNIMHYFRNTPPSYFDGIAVDHTIDYLLQHDPNSTWPKVDVLQFILIDDSQISIRPSGTEPKLKIYLSICTKPSKSGSSASNHEEIESVLQRTHDKMQKLRYALLTQVQQIVF